MEQKVIFKTEGIYKSFASTKALVDVKIELHEGEVLGLIGENGSGKSTLSTIIAGTQRADAGEMFLDGEVYRPEGIVEAMERGVSMVVQEQGTLSGLSVAANIFAGKEQLFSKYGLLNTKRMNQAAQELLKSIGIEGVDPRQMVDELSFEERKLLEVARAEFHKPRILIVDETTTALGKEGRAIMYAMIQRMRDEGRSVILISHDIDELLETCDRVSVLRDGVNVGSLAGEEMEPGAMKKMMVGRDVPENVYRTDYGPYAPGEAALRAEHITHAGLRDISLTLHRGEILGIGGLTDCGMHELGRILFGLTEPDVGCVRAGEGMQITSPGEAIRAHMGYVSKNRDTEALMAAASIQDNICLPMLPKLARGGLVSPRRELEYTKKWSDILHIKMRGPRQQVMELSGGNKQKVSIAKWLASDADIFIFDCPTRGIDIGVKNDIYDLLAQLRSEGKAILMISEELPELIGMSDRILILKSGAVSGEFPRNPSLGESDLIEHMI